MLRLKEKYNNEIAPALKEQFKYKSVMEIPKLEKIVINMGLGEVKENPKAIESAISDLTLITGQKPIVTKAKKSVAAFKLREGMNIGCKVTLRGLKMYAFADKLINITLPRIRDFHGIPGNSFDGRGNYALGMDVIFVTTAKTDEEAKVLLKMMGMPFDS